MSSESVSIEQGLDEYLVSLRVERGLSQNTIAAYTRDLKQYLDYLDGRDPTEEIVGGFVSSLRRQGLANSTVGRKIAAIRGLHRFLTLEDLRETDPTATLATPKRRESIPKALSIDQTLRMLEAPDLKTRAGRRDSAILETLYATGCRVSELRGIDLTHVDLDDLSIRVTGKGNRQRIVPIGRPGADAIQRWLPDRLELVRRSEPGDPMFVSLRGTRLSRQAIFDIVKKAASEAGIPPEKVSPHVLRHSAATHMVEAGADLRTVQEILGHATITTTQVYTRVSPSHIMEIYVEAHPRSR